MRQTLFILCLLWARVCDSLLSDGLETTAPSRRRPPFQDGFHHDSHEDPTGWVLLGFVAVILVGAFLL